MGRLVIASNRTATPGQPRAGGLAVALADALTERGGGLWFGWSGEIGEREQRGAAPDHARTRSSSRSPT